MSATRCPPPPPPGFTAPLSVTRLAPGDPWVRIHWASRAPLEFQITSRANRFDPLPAPWSTTEVLYAGDDLDVALAETIVRWRDQVAPGVRIILSSSDQLAPRAVSRFDFRRPLEVIDATGPGLSKIRAALDAVVGLGASGLAGSPSPRFIPDDIFQCGADEYPATQAWGAWFRAQCPSADGILWMSRQLNTGKCLVLFNDRCGPDLVQQGTTVPLLNPGSAETQALDLLLDKIGWERD